MIHNLADLREEIERLKESKKEQEAAIKQHFSSPTAVINTVLGTFNSSWAGGKQDIVGLLSRFILPFTLNKTIFRSSNFLVKAAVGLLSQKASGFISEKSIGSVWDKIKTMIPRKKSSNKKDVDYGIPPFSESY